jgi:hypothetical protein
MLSSIVVGMKIYKNFLQAESISACATLPRVCKPSILQYIFLPLFLRASTSFLLIQVLHDSVTFFCITITITCMEVNKVKEGRETVTLSPPLIRRR